MLKRLKEDCIQVNTQAMEELYSEILGEAESEGNAYNITGWYVYDLKDKPYYDEYRYEVFVEVEGELKSWGDELVEEFFQKVKVNK